MPALEDFDDYKVLVGEDSESRTYAKVAGDSDVVRIYNDSSASKYDELSIKKSMCDILRSAGLPFEIENIESVHLEEGRLYTKERRISGLSLGQILDQNLAESLNVYRGIAKTLRESHTPELLPVFNWAAFISKRANNAISEYRLLLKTNGITVSYEQAVQLNTLLKNHLGGIESFGLIHGRLSPANCLVDPNNKTKVVAVLNFSEDTVIGDPRLEVANQLFFAESLDESIRAAATKDMLAYIIATYGARIDPIINLYRIYQALMLLDNARYGAWAIHVLHNWQAIIDAKDIWQLPVVTKPVLRSFWSRLKITPRTTMSEPHSPTSPFSAGSSTSEDSTGSPTLPKEPAKVLKRRPSNVLAGIAEVDDENEDEDLSTGKSAAEKNRLDSW